MGRVLLVFPGFSLRLVGVRRFRPIPATNANTTRRAAIFRSWTLDCATGAIRTFFASFVRAQAVGAILALFYTRVRFLFVLSSCFQIDWIGQNVRTQRINLGPIALHLDWPLSRRQHQSLMASEQKLCVILESIKTGCHLIGFGPLDELFRPVQMLNQIPPVQQLEMLHWQYS